MTAILDIESFEGVAVRPQRRKTVTNTNPLCLEQSERKALDEVTAKIVPYLGKQTLMKHEQMIAFHASIECMEACLAGDWSAMAASAQAGLEAALRVHSITPCLLSKQDEAARDLASDERAELHKIAMRLGHAAPAATRTDEDRARCLRAATYAAIAADRGLLHLLKENLGCVIRTLAHDECPVRREVVWTDALLDLARRYRSAGVRVP